ncbi:hypothetical protein N9D23_01780 [Rubripirellula sp.]|nr:hypothetical protein [Rubripirellula sp.]
MNSRGILWQFSDIRHYFGWSALLAVPVAEFRHSRPDVISAPFEAVIIPFVVLERTHASGLVVF